MRNLLPALLAAALLTGCASPTEEKAFAAISEFYGGSVAYKKGVNAFTNTSELQGRYLSVSLNSPGITRRFEQLDIPASNCAYLAYPGRAGRLQLLPGGNQGLGQLAQL